MTDRMDEINAEMAEMIDVSHCFNETERRAHRAAVRGSKRWRDLRDERDWLAQADYLPLCDIISEFGAPDDR